MDDSVIFQIPAIPTNDHNAIPFIQVTPSNQPLTARNIHYAFSWIPNLIGNGNIYLNVLDEYMNVKICDENKQSLLVVMIHIHNINITCRCLSLKGFSVMSKPTNFL